MEDKQRSKALELAIASVEKEFGRGAIMRLKDGESIHGDVPVVPSGSLGLDIALGIGGYPRGRIIEIYGPESSGKTTLMLHAIANVQRQGGVAAFIDAEHALDVTYARKLGVKTDDLLISQPDFGEQALEIADMLVRSNAVDIVVVDSVAALVPKAEIEGDMGDSHVGLQARLMSQALRKLTGSVARSQCMLAFTNQIRMKIGVMFGSPETTTGGNALKFYASVRLDVRRVGAIKEAGSAAGATGGASKDPVVIGNRTRVKVVKNKMAPPFREVEFDILYGQGVSRSGEVVDLASDLGIVAKSGAWYSLDGERIGQGRDNARSYLEQNQEVLTRIEQRVLEHHGIHRVSRPLEGSREDAESKAEPTKAEAKKGGAAAGASSGSGSASSAGGGVPNASANSPAGAGANKGAAPSGPAAAGKAPANGAPKRPTPRAD
jgi:recombination protein RecA